VHCRGDRSLKTVSKTSMRGPSKGVWREARRGWRVCMRDLGKGKTRGRKGKPFRGTHDSGLPSFWGVRGDALVAIYRRRPCKKGRRGRGWNFTTISGNDVPNLRAVLGYIELEKASPSVDLGKGANGGKCNCCPIAEIGGSEKKRKIF